MIETIYCDGDSWTRGDFLDPDHKSKGINYNINHSLNSPYTLPKVWPHKLGELMDIEIYNKSYAGSSNDGIVRRVISNVYDLQKKYKPEDIVVIIGWSSPERKDFYFKGRWADNSNLHQGWETIYPAELTQKLKNKDLKKFYEIYLKLFWHQEEYMDRFMHQNLYLHNYLNGFGIKHLFFESFYESKKVHMLDDVDMMDYFKVDKQGGLKQKMIDDMQHNWPPRRPHAAQFEYQNHINLLNQFNYIYKEHFMPISFRRYIHTLRKGEHYKTFHEAKKWFDDYHPTENAHQLWSEKLYEYLKEII